jgi:hypothetical protein
MTTPVLVTSRMAGRPPFRPEPLAAFVANLWVKPKVAGAGTQGVRARGAAARALQAEKKRADALRHLRADLATGKMLNADDLRALYPDDVQALRTGGEAALRKLVGNDDNDNAGAAPRLSSETLRQRKERLLKMGPKDPPPDPDWEAMGLEEDSFALATHWARLRRNLTATASFKVMVAPDDPNQPAQTLDQIMATLAMPPVRPLDVPVDEIAAFMLRDRERAVALDNLNRSLRRHEPLRRRDLEALYGQDIDLIRERGDAAVFALAKNSPLQRVRERSHEMELTR